MTPALLPATTEGEDMSKLSFFKHVEEFGRRSAVLGKAGHARSNWLKADGAHEDYQFTCDGERIVRKEYDAIIAVLKVQGRRQGRTGDSPTLLKEEEANLGGANH